MSLQIWLPLNGSLENQGVANAPLMGSYTPTYSENGLFGKSFSCKNAVKYNAKGIIKSTEYTLTTWIKSISTTGWWLAISLKYSNGTQTTNNLYNAPNGRFKFEYVPEQNIYCDVSQWHHLAFVVKGNQMISYLDGEQYNIYNFTNEERLLDYLQIGNANADMWLNDVRLYDNALSPKEVKEISNGLLIHYPMRDMYIEAVDNLTAAPVVKKDYVNSTWNASLHPGAKEVNGWSVGYNGGVPTPETGYHAYWKVIDDIPTMVMINKNSEFSKKGRWLGVSSSSSASLTAAVMASKIYTISFDAKTNTSGTKVTGGLYSRLVGASSNAFNDNQFAFYPTDEWKRYSITVIPNEDIDPTKGSSVYFYGHSGAEGIVYIRNPQIIAGESSIYIGDQVTSGGLCIDSSGYYNNANTIAGTVTYSDDSPRGYGSFKFNGSSYLRTENILIPQIHTISAWINYHERGKHLIDWRDSNGNGLQPIYFGADGKIQYWTSAGTSSYFNYVVPMDEWHHIVLTCNGATVKLYVDGVLRGTQATAIASDKRPITIGGRCNAANIIKAEMADFRVYTTELSADDILKLYNVPIWIDENQTLGAIGFVEEIINNNKFEKTGTVETRGIDTVIETGNGFFEQVYNNQDFWTVAEDGMRFKAWPGLDFTLEDGKQYKVVYGNNTYIYTATVGTSGDVFIGNGYYGFRRNGENNGEPVCLYNYSENDVHFYTKDYANTLTVYKYVNEYTHENTKVKIYDNHILAKHIIEI